MTVLKKSDGCLDYLNSNFKLLVCYNFDSKDYYQSALIIQLKCSENIENKSENNDKKYILD